MGTRGFRFLRKGKKEGKGPPGRDKLARCRGKTSHGFEDRQALENVRREKTKERILNFCVLSLSFLTEGAEARVETSSEVVLGELTRSINNGALLPRPPGGVCTS